MPRVRTAKSVARRIDLQYFAHSHGLRRARFLLSIALPLVAGAWLLAEFAAGNRMVYTSGPLSPAHAVFGAQCSLCHLKQAAYQDDVPDRACLACHDAPTHNLRQQTKPSCSSCHIEHQGRMRLAVTGDSSCVRCHGDLKTTDNKLNVAEHVSGWDDDHPEFKVLRPGGIDPGTIKLNHYVHLQPTLRGPNGPVQMKCDDCHRFAMHGPWPYSVRVVDLAPQSPVNVAQPLEQQRKRYSVSPGASAYAIPIKYVNQCAACHVLQFDPLIPEPAPHDKPEKVREFIIAKLTEYIAKNPSALRLPVSAGLPLERQEPRNILRPTEMLESPTEKLASTPAQWVQQRTAIAEQLLWRKNCHVCHAQTIEEGGVLPTKVTAVIPVRWLPRTEFDHQAHRMLICTSCHMNIPKSRLTSDINIPGIAVCRQCHKQAGAQGRAADGRCYECHAYHDWRNEKFTDGKFDIRQVRGHGPAATALSVPVQQPLQPAPSPSAPQTEPQPIPAPGSAP